MVKFTPVTERVFLFEKNVYNEPMNWLVLLSILSFGGYFFTNKKPFTYSLKTGVDRKIKAVPVFVIPYVLFFPYIIFTFFSLETNFRNDFALSLILCNLAATAFWYFLPNGVVREVLDGNSFFAKLINFIYKNDGDTNGFPSGHVFVSLICSYYLALAMPAFAPLYWLTGSVISISTVLTKQHYILDILGGVIFATLAIFSTQLFF